jgi:hypothetical protein
MSMIRPKEMPAALAAAFAWSAASATALAIAEAPAADPAARTVAWPVVVTPSGLAAAQHPGGYGISADLLLTITFPASARWALGPEPLAAGGELTGGEDWADAARVTHTTPAISTVMAMIPQHQRARPVTRIRFHLRRCDLSPWTAAR